MSAENELENGPQKTSEISSEKTGDIFDGKKSLAIDLLSVGTPHAEVARRLGVCRRTITNWLADELYAQAVEDRRQDIAKTLRAGLLELAPQAITTLKNAMADGGVASIRAAELVLRTVGALKPDNQQTAPQETELEFSTPPWLEDEQTA